MSMSTESPQRPIPDHEIQGMLAEEMRRQSERPVVEAEGLAALRRLFKIAQGDTGQSGRIARFLLGLYNGARFPFDLTDFRSLDHALFLDCLAVLRMDSSPRQEVHTYFPGGGNLFEAMAADWGVRDAWAERIELKELREQRERSAGAP